MAAIKTLGKGRRMEFGRVRILLVVVLLFVSACSTKSLQEAELAKSVNEPEQLWRMPANQEAASYLAECKQGYEKVITLMNELSAPTRTYEASALLAVINDIDLILDGQINLAGLYANVHPNEAMRTSGETCEQNFMALVSQISLSRPLYNRLSTLDPQKLDDIDRRFLEHMLRDYKRSGVDKDEATRQRIGRLNEEINLIGQDFDKNIRSGSRQLILNSLADLKGLPQDYIEKHQPNEQGKIVLTTAYPDYFPFMQYAQSDALRKQFYILFRQQAYPENKAVLLDLVNKRHELAQLLGYANFAEYITEDKMIKSAGNAQNFIDRVSTIATAKADDEYQVLLKRLQKIDPKATEVTDWQKVYLEELVKKEQYQVSAQEVRQYFQYDNVRQGMFDLTQTMFGISIKPWKTAVWHDSVEAYEVWDQGEVVGRFYLDMHPREGKYKHAAEFPIQNGITGKQLPVAALVCNFPGGDDSEGLMEHSDVETFLHEFGHLLHNIFAGRNQRWMYFSGIKTEWDFVEAPSQMLEEWVWDADTLATFARNKKGETIPPALIKKMQAGREFGRGMWTKHQLFYAALSLGLYNQDPAAMDLDKFMEQVQSNYSPFGYVDDTYFYTSFGHLNGYSAIYYTYMWSLVIAADMHSEFSKKGLRNRELAQYYRKTVLAPGGERDAADMVTEFLGRPYNFDAFAKELTKH